MNELHFGDNLDVLSAMPTESVDLIYLDPPFNSNADYGLLYGTQRGGPSKAQAHAFDDMWSWGEDAQDALRDTRKRHMNAGALLDAFESQFPGSPMMAYLAMMAVRLIEMKRVLKPSGSLYLHCDSTASHYLKALLDSIFGSRNYINEIIWRRYTRPKGSQHEARRFGRSTDTILVYGKSSDYKFYLGRLKARMDSTDEEKRYNLSDEQGPYYSGPLLRSASMGARPNLVYEYKGYTPGEAGWRMTQKKLAELDARGDMFWTSKGVPRRKVRPGIVPGTSIDNLWTDIEALGAQAQERLGYPTQKPLALLERIINASSDAGDVVLDPFCGCGTAIEAAQNLGRRWIGIDVTYLAVHVIEGRLVKAFGPDIRSKYQLFGRPEDADDARVLAARDWLEFQKWAVMMLGGIPKDRPGADGGIDGIIRYHRVGIEQPNKGIVSVKGGLHVGVDAIHKLKSVVDREKAEIGVLVCLDKPTQAMVREALSVDPVGPPSKRVPKLQIVTVDDLFAREPVRLPGIIDLPEIGRTPVVRTPKKARKRIQGQGELLLPIPGQQQEETAKMPKRSIRSVDIEVVRATRKRG